MSDFEVMPIGTSKQLERQEVALRSIAVKPDAACARSDTAWEMRGIACAALTAGHGKASQR